MALPYSDDGYIYYSKPVVLSASLEPNTAACNEQITIIVEVDEITVKLEPVWFYSGEIYSGEAI
jgi:hypothetical protein